MLHKILLRRGVSRGTLRSMTLTFIIATGVSIVPFLMLVSGDQQGQYAILLHCLQSFFGALIVVGTIGAILTTSKLMIALGTIFFILSFGASIAMLCVILTSLIDPQTKGEFDKAFFIVWRLMCAGVIGLVPTTWKTSVNLA